MSDAISETVPLPDAPIHQGQRLHPATLLFSLGKIGPRALNFAPGLLALGVFSDWRIAMLGALAFLAVGLIFDVLNWMRFRYTIDSDDVRIDSGVIERSHVIIPFARIQDVSIEQGPIARMLGLAKVQLETGGQGSIVQNDGVLDVIAFADASQLRDAIRSYRQNMADAVADSVAAEGQASPKSSMMDDARPVYTMDLRRVFTAGLFNFSLTLFAVLFALLNQLDDVLPFDVFAPDDWIDLLGRDNPVFDYVDAHRWLVAVLGVISVAILGVITGIIRTTLRDYDFRLTRTQTGLRRTRGLLTRTDVSLPVARVQAAMIAHGPVQRLFGWREVKLQSLGNDQAGNDGKVERDHLVAPLARSHESDAILAELRLAEPTADATWSAPHPAYSRVLIIPMLLAMAGASIAAMISSPWLWSALPVIAIIFASTIYARMRHGWMYDQQILYIRRGGLSRRILIIPARNIQSVDIGHGPILRRFGVVSLELGISGGSVLPPGISAISRDMAYALRDGLLKPQ